MTEKLYVPNGVKRVLISYWYEQDPKKFADFKQKNPGVEIMLDSGAFSAKTKERVIKVEDYVKFCNEVYPYVDHIMALDVIGSFEKSKENYDYMLEHLEKTDKLIPVYHTTEPYDILEYYLSKADYIAVGIFREIKPDRRKFWNYIANILDRIPTDKKVHLLGVNAAPLLFLYAHRVTSVDSTSMSKMSGDMNRVFNLGGMPTTIKGFEKGRLTIPDRNFLRKINIMRELKLEREINDYIGEKPDAVNP